MGASSAETRRHVSPRGGRSGRGHGWDRAGRGAGASGSRVLGCGRRPGAPGGGRTRGAGTGRACPARPAAHVLLPDRGHHHAAARPRPGDGAVDRVGDGPGVRRVAVLRLRAAVGRRRDRPADHVAGGALVAAAVPCGGVPAGRRVGDRPRADADSRRRAGAERRGPLDPAGPAPVPAVRAGQARARGLGCRPARPQGEARHARRLAAHARPADARAPACWPCW